MATRIFTFEIKIERCGLRLLINCYIKLLEIKIVLKNEDRFRKKDGYHLFHILA